MIKVKMGLGEINLVWVIYKKYNNKAKNYLFIFYYNSHIESLIPKKYHKKREMQKSMYK